MSPLDVRTYGYRFAAELATGARDPDLWEKLLTRVERSSFLARQAEHHGDFEQTSRDLELHFLPELVRRREWPRFLHLALVAANLRGLAEDLDEPPILRALARSGRLPLAEKLVAQLADPLRRARARAVLAATVPASAEEFGRLVDALRDDLDDDLRRDARRRDPAAAAAWCETLVAIAACVGPELRARWPAWVAELAGRDVRDGRDDGLADRAWRALAESFLQRGEEDAEELWSSLRGIRDPAALAEFVPDRLALGRRADPWPLLRRLRDLDPVQGGELAWRAAVAVLGAEAAEPPGIAAHAAEAGWRRAAAELGPAPWSERLVETGRRLWAALPEEVIAALLAEIGDPVARAGLAVVRLEAHPASGTAGPALDAVERVSEPAPRLHWALRYLLARPREPRREVEAQAAAVVRHLARVRWAAPAGDLCRYLDLVARVFPRHLRTQAENVLWTPNGDAETLRTLARECGERAVLDELFPRAEDYAAMAGATAAEGFELRREVLVILAGRLCAADRSLDPLGRAAERLLPEEEDGLRCEVARRLAEVGEPALALEAAAGLQSRRLALLTRLEIAPGEVALGPSEIYEAVAANPAVSDERRALAALLELPSDPAAIAREHLEAITRKGRQIEALIDLAHHALAYQRQRFRRGLQDRLAAILPLKEALGVVESDEWLAALTPELVAVGARLGPARAVAEIQEAMERVVGLTMVPWERRKAVLLRLVTGIEGFLSEEGAALTTSQRRRAVGLIEWIGRLPGGRADGDGQAELRRDWHSLLPWLRLVEERLDVPAGRGLFRLREKWTWLTAEQTEVVDLGFLPEIGRRTAESFPAKAAAAGPLRAHACLALSRAPEHVRELVILLSPGAERDRLVLELIRFAPERSLSPELAAALTAEVSPAARPWARAWAWLREATTRSERVWPGALIELAAEALVDLDDPVTAPLRRCAWRAPREECLEALARAAGHALAAGGKPACEQALRLFLNVHLAPALGTPGGEQSSRCLAETAAAEQRAWRLGSRPEAGDARA